MPRHGYKLLLPLMERYAEIEYRSDCMAAAPPTDAKTYMSQYTGSQTEQADPGDDIAPPAQPLRLTNGPKPPLNQGMQSPQARGIP